MPTTDSRTALSSPGLRKALSQPHQHRLGFCVTCGTPLRDCIALGGEGSGNFGHAGRPGEVGGSAPADGGGGGGGKSYNELLKKESERVNRNKQDRKSYNELLKEQADRERGSKEAKQATAENTHGGVPVDQNAPGAPGVAGPPAEEYVRPEPIKVKTVDEALEHMLAGKVVELQDIKQVNTLIGRLAKIAQDAQAKKEDAPNYDLCKVSVAGTNLFCAEVVREAKYPNGRSRFEMPQLGGKPRPGSDADKLPKNKKGEVDGSAAFRTWLEKRGIKVADVEEVPAAGLKASQTELVGTNVGGMMDSHSLPKGHDKYYDPSAEPIYISRDNHVIDGHHRWAAIVGKDAEDGVLGDRPMRVVRIDAPATELLALGNMFAEEYGILPKAAGVKGQIKMRREDWERVLQMSYRERLEYLLRPFDLGDVPGHPFRGNQYTDGEGGGTATAEREPLARTEEAEGREPAARTEEEKAEVRENKEAIEDAWADINRDLLPLLKDDLLGEKPETRALIEEQRRLAKEMHRLNIEDTGDPEDVGVPGGVRDVLIIGAGPAGMAAGIMAGAEGLDSVLIEAEHEPGGAPKHSSRIENYPGFPAGVSGKQMSKQMFEQVQRMGTETKLGVRVESIEHDPVSGLHTVKLSNGDEIKTRTVIVGSGLKFERPKFPGGGDQDPNVVTGDIDEAMQKAGSGPVVVLGGGNGAGQAALGAGQTNATTIISRSPLNKSMSAYVERGVEHHPNVDVVTGEVVDRYVTENGKRYVVTKDRAGTEKKYEAAAIAGFLGSKPETGFLPAGVKRSEKRINEYDVEEPIPVPKPGEVDRRLITTDFRNRTSVPGIFAAGDVRDRGDGSSNGRIGLAIADGQLAVRELFGHFKRETLRLKGKRLRSDTYYVWMRQYLLGDVPGHPFRGNQYSTGEGSGSAGSNLPLATGSPATRAPDYERWVKEREDRNRGRVAMAAESRPKFDSLVEKISKPDGGFTADAAGEVPKKGFALSVYKGRERVLQAKDISLADLAKFARDNNDLLKQKGNFFGAWHNPEDGNVYLDVSKVVDTPEEANRLGQANDQIAYFDLEHGHSVDIPKKAA